MPTNISRRAFIRLALLAGIGGGLALFRKLTAPMNPLSYLRWKSRGLWVENFGSPSVVALGECPTYQANIVEVLSNLWNAAEMPEVQGKRILIKPNLVDEVEGHYVTTAPEVVLAAVQFLQEKGAAEIWVGDGPAFRRDAGAVAQKIGLLPALQKHQVPFIDLNYDDPIPVAVRDGWFPAHDHIWLPRHAVQADYILSLAKMKTHHWAQVSLSMKNLLGLLPGAKYGWPKNFIHFSGIPQTILGIHQVLPPVLSVIDGIIGMQGDGPLFGSPVEHGILAAGRDPVAVDMVCKELMGFDTWSVDYLNLAAWAGIGQAHRIDIRGVDPVLYRRNYQKPPTI